MVLFDVLKRQKKIKGMFLVKCNLSVEFHFKIQAGTPQWAHHLHQLLLFSMERDEGSSKVRQLRGTPNFVGSWESVRGRNSSGENNSTTTSVLGACRKVCWRAPRTTWLCTNSRSDILTAPVAGKKRPIHMHERSAVSFCGGGGRTFPTFYCKLGEGPGSDCGHGRNEPASFKCATSFCARA